MVIKNLVFSIISFFVSAICSILLFVGLFSAKWDYVVTHTADTIFVLAIGTLLPISFILGIIFLIRGFLFKEPYAWLFLIISILLSIYTMSIGLEIFLTSVINLYKIKLGIT